MEKNRGTLITIIVLLLVFIPCSIVGTIKHFEDKNKNHDFYYEGSLYFYQNNTLIGTYKCKTKNCDYASYNIIDTEEKKKTSLINNQYAFIEDGEKIYLEDIKNGWNINEYKELKGYSSPIEKDSYITQNKDGLWGIISMNPSLVPTLQNKYDDINLEYDSTQKEVKLNKIFVKEKELYKIIKDNKDIYTSENRIVECNENLVVTKLSDETYQIENYEHLNYFEDTNILKYLLFDNYIAIWSFYNLEIYSINESNTINLINSYDSYADAKLENNILNIYEYDEIIDSYEL